jgi:hypothetical protein
MSGPLPLVHPYGDKNKHRTNLLFRKDWNVLSERRLAGVGFPAPFTNLQGLGFAQTSRTVLLHARGVINYVSCIKFPDPIRTAVRVRARVGPRVGAPQLRQARTPAHVSVVHFYPLLSRPRPAILPFIDPSEPRFWRPTATPAPSASPKRSTYLPAAFRRAATVFR